MQSDGHIHSNTGRKSTTHGIHLYIPKESATSLLGNTQVHNVTSCWRETGRRDAGTTRAPSGPRRRTGRRQHQASASAQASRSLHSMTRAKEHRCSPENKVGDLGKMNRPGFRDPLPGDGHAPRKLSSPGPPKGRSPPGSASRSRPLQGSADHLSGRLTQASGRMARRDLMERFSCWKFFFRS